MGITRVPVCPECLAQPQSLLAEYFCARCRTPFANRFPLNDSGICALCAAGLRGFDRAYSFGSYEGPLRVLIHLFKYSGMKPLASRLGALLCRALPEEDYGRFDIIVPMPLHWRKRLKRGFNQAAMLARYVGSELDLPVRNASVRRVRATAVQAGLTNSNRRKNVSGAFQVPDTSMVANKRILLIDDVMTTGATGASCAAALKRAGASSVTLLTLARVDRRFAAMQVARKSM